MSELSVEKPKIRGPLRLALGAAYFRVKRRLLWRFGGIRFARLCPLNADMAKEITKEHFAHKTPLLRKLKDVDMYLQHNKIKNLQIAISQINGITIHPGEVFSYWRLIGKPTRRKGYVKGMLLKHGRVTAGIGGGLCQLSNLIYWMTIHTPLTVAERHRHSFDVFPDSGRTQPFGSGATCFYNYIDLMIKNETTRPFQLVLSLTDTHLKGKWLSNSPPEFRYKVYEKSHAIRSHFWGGYTRHNLIHRKVLGLCGKTLDDQFIAQNHAVMMYNPLLPDSSTP